ncbi:MAG: hypothetical protein KDK28_17475 [Maritimibacter sp.]|nr:hypothetical protein [Maritimibacter sp.]
MSNLPAGVRFSLNYISHPELLPDSQRMRRRFGALFVKHCRGGTLRKLLNSELGTDLKINGCETESYWPRAMLAVELRDVLDTVTLVYKVVLGDDHYHKDQGAKYLSEVSRVFEEERVRYNVDKKGGVHLTVDSAFEQTRISSVQALAHQRYEGVRQALEAAHSALDQVPPDGKAALRNTFFANENLFRLAFPTAHQLGKGELNKHLKPAVDKKYSGANPDIHAAQKQFSQYVNWVEGAHFYRHESGTEEPTQPPLEVAIHYFSTGTAWLRWLQSFDTPKQ